MDNVFQLVWPYYMYLPIEEHHGYSHAHFIDRSSSNYCGVSR